MSPGAVVPTMAVGRALVAILAVVTLSGCVGILPDQDGATTLVLRYTLHNTSPTAEVRYAGPGEHCGTAHIEDGRAVVERDALDDVGTQRPFLVVLPALEGGWATTGTEGFPLALTAVVDPGVQGDEEPVATIGWRTEGDRTFATVDAEPVELPHEWDKIHEPGQWRAELRLSMGPDRIDTFRMQTCA